MLSETKLLLLEQAIDSNIPECKGLFKPGISEEKLTSLEAEIHLFRFSEDVRMLYRWHDGAEEPLQIIPGYSFLTLEEAITEYKAQLELDGGSEGYNPLWFPLFSYQGDNYCVILSKDEQLETKMYFNAIEDTEIRIEYSNLETMIDIATHCFNSYAYIFDEEYLEKDPKIFNQILEDSGEKERTKQLDTLGDFSKYFTTNWPTEWRDAIGRTDEDYQLVGPDNTVSDYLSKPSQSRVHVQIVGLEGTTDYILMTIKDVSGQITAYCRRTTVGAREVQIGRSYEMEIAPPSDNISADASVTHVIWCEG